MERSFIAPSFGLGGLTILVSLFAATLYAYAESLAVEPMVPLVGQRLPDWELKGAVPAPPELKIGRLEIIFATKIPNSPRSGHYTSKGIHERFGETGAQFRAVLDWVKSYGFQIQDRTYGHSIDWIAFSGTIGQAERTFNTQLVWFKQTGAYANKSDAQIPMRFKGVIGSVVGLYNFPSPKIRVLR